MMNLEDKTLAELTSIYNSAADRPVKKLQDKKSGISRITTLAKTKGLVLATNGDRLVTPDKAPGTEVVGSGRGRMRYTDDMVIVVDRKAEPKKITRRNPYKVYQTGITVAEAISRGVTRRDINWDAGEKRPGGPVIRVMPKEQYERLTA